MQPLCCCTLSQSMPPVCLANCRQASKPRELGLQRTGASAASCHLAPRKVMQQPGHLLHQHPHSPALAFLAHSLTFPRSNTAMEERETMTKSRWALHTGKQELNTLLLPQCWRIPLPRVIPTASSAPAPDAEPTAATAAPSTPNHMAAELLLLSYNITPMLSLARVETSW